MYMRTMAAFAVVLLHTAQYNADFFNIKGYDKILSFTVRNCMLWAVPIFVMVTGALLLNPNRKLGYRKLFSRYVLRILVALLGCVFLCNILDQYIFKTETAKHVFPFLLDAIRDFLTAGGWDLLWYLYMLVALYITLPFFRTLTKNSSRTDLIYAVALLFCFQSLIPTTAHLLGTESGFYILIFSIYPLYILLGYWISGLQTQNAPGAPALHFGGFPKQKECLGLAFFVVAVCFLFDIVFSIACFKFGWITLFENMTLYSFPVTVVQAAGIFYIFEKIPLKAPSLLMDIDRHTLAIYLIHIFLLKLLSNAASFNPYRFGFWMIFAEAIFLFFASYLLAKSWAWVRERGGAVFTQTLRQNKTK